MYQRLDTASATIVASDKELLQESVYSLCSVQKSSHLKLICGINFWIVENIIETKVHSWSWMRWHFGRFFWPPACCWHCENAFQKKKPSPSHVLVDIFFVYVLLYIPTGWKILHFSIHGDKIPLDSWTVQHIQSISVNNAHCDALLRNANHEQTVWVERYDNCDGWGLLFCMRSNILCTCWNSGSILCGCGNFKYWPSWRTNPPIDDIESRSIIGARQSVCSSFSLW